MSLNCGTCLLENAEIVPLVEVPTCPHCKKENTLILVEQYEMMIRCSKDAGGCGAVYVLEEIKKLYVLKCKKGHLAKESK